MGRNEAMVIAIPGRLSLWNQSAVSLSKLKLLKLIMVV